MFGASAVLGKIALQAFPSYSIVGFRVGGAALAFYFLLRINGDLRLDRKSHYFYFALFSCFGVVINQFLFFKGLSLTSATNTSLLAVTMPVFTILISGLIGNDKLTWRKLGGIGLAAAGVVYLIDPAEASFSSQTTQGDILIILNCLSYSIYLAISKNLFSHYGALKSITLTFMFASVINFPVGMYFLQPVDLGQVGYSAWSALIAIVLFTTILAYYLNAWALARVEPSIVAVYIYLQPLIGFFMAVMFLGEQWNYRALLAMFLISVGVFLVTLGKTIKDERGMHLT
jgi:drug/metabolite transporter (DMT)-like permease